MALQGRNPSYIIMDDLGSDKKPTPEQIQNTHQWLILQFSTKTKSPMTWLKFFNVFIFQWFFIRLTKHQNVRKEKVNGETLSVAYDGKAYWSFQYWIVPCTGWKGSFTFVRKKGFWYINKYKRKEQAFEIKKAQERKELEDRIYANLISNVKSWHDKSPILELTQKEFDELDEYSCSQPTGTTIGKRWKCNYTAFRLDMGKREPLWVIFEYAEHPDPNLVAIKNYRLRIIEKPLEEGEWVTDGENWGKLFAIALGYGFYTDQIGYKRLDDLKNLKRVPLAEINALKQAMA